MRQGPTWRACSSRTIRRAGAHRYGSRISATREPLVGAVVPIQPVVFNLRYRCDPAARRRKRLAVGSSAYLPLPPVECGWP